MARDMCSDQKIYKYDIFWGERRQTNLMNRSIGSLNEAPSLAYILHLNIFLSGNSIRSGKHTTWKGDSFYIWTGSRKFLNGIKFPLKAKSCLLFNIIQEPIFENECVS